MTRRHENRALTAIAIGLVVIAGYGLWKAVMGLWEVVF